jgi:hypothetical protein
MTQIHAFNGSFGISAVRLGHWECQSNEDRTLSLWSERESLPVHVTTQRGEFIEVIDAIGKVALEGGDGNWLWVPVSKEPVRLRFKALPDPKLSKGQIQKIRQKVTRYLSCDSPYNLGVPAKLPEAISWMQEQLAAIPEPCRKNASFEFGTTTEYGETYPQITISYEEHETDKEVLERVKVERERTRIAELAERQKLEQLQQKYGSKTRGAGA